MTALIVYVSGPMTGYPGFNFTAFDRAEHALTGAGFIVINPARNYGGRTDLTRAQYMRLDISHVLASEGLATLEGWEKSRGARLEVEIAEQLELPVRPVEVWLKEAAA